LGQGALDLSCGRISPATKYPRVRHSLREIGKRA
jgi:hypothetical protein